MSQLFNVAVSESVPPDTAYIVRPGDTGTLASHPRLAGLLAEGDVVVARSAEQAEEIDEVRGAMRQVVRVQL